MSKIFRPKPCQRGQQRSGFSSTSHGTCCDVYVLNMTHHIFCRTWPLVFLRLGTFWGKILIIRLSILTPGTRVKASILMLLVTMPGPPIASFFRCTNQFFISLIRTIGAASTILLKNTNGALPLAKPKTIGVIGNGAGSNPQGPNG
jgi:hypothetical protein